MEIYQRTEGGHTFEVSVKDGLQEINHAQMNGRRSVKSMSQITRTDYVIEYKNGSKVTFHRTEAKQAPTMNVVGVRGGKVHAMSAWSAHGEVNAQCRSSARTQYRETTADITCEVCAENVRRSN